MKIPPYQVNTRCSLPSRSWSKELCHYVRGSTSVLSTQRASLAWKRIRSFTWQIQLMWPFTATENTSSFRCITKVDCCALASWKCKYFAPVWPSCFLIDLDSKLLFWFCRQPTAAYYRRWLARAGRWREVGGTNGWWADGLGQVSSWILLQRIKQSQPADHRRSCLLRSSRRRRIQLRSG